MNYRKKQWKLSVLQHRIVQATQKKQQRKIRNLQRLLIKNLSARIQAILIVSKKKNLASFFFSREKKHGSLEKKGSIKNVSFRLKNIFFYKKTKGIQQIKFLESMNVGLLKTFVLKFYKKIFYFFVIVKIIIRKLKKKTKKNQKSLNDVTKNIEIFLLNFFYSSPHFSLFFQKKNTKNSLFLLLWNLACSPVIETLLKKKFRNPSEIILFLNHFCFKSTNFIQIKTKQVDNSKIFSRWILKLEIEGFFEHLNNSWLFQTFPTESIIVRNFFDEFKNDYSLIELNKRNSLFLKRKKKFFLFHKDFFKKWNSLNSENFFFENFVTPNFDNFFNFSLIGLEDYLKDVSYVLHEFYFSEFILEPQLFFSIGSIEPTYELEPKKQIQIFYYPRSIYLTGINGRQFKRLEKLIDFFLKQRGLECNVKKTTLFDLKKGFDLLGWTLKKTQKKDLIVQISQSLLLYEKKEIKWLIKNSKDLSFHQLIIKLNKKIKNDLIEYENQRLYNISENVEKIYNDLNFFINQIFWKWAKKRHNNRSNSWILKKYWFFRNKKNYLTEYFLKKKFFKSRQRVFVLLYEKKNKKVL